MLPLATSDNGLNFFYSSTVNGENQFQSNLCTGCKNRDSTAVARCLTCSNFLCPNCVTAHQVRNRYTSTNRIAANYLDRSSNMYMINCIYILVHALLRWTSCDNFRGVNQQRWMPPRNSAAKQYFTSHARWKIQSFRFKI